METVFRSSLIRDCTICSYLPVLILGNFFNSSPNTLQLSDRIQFYCSYQKCLDNITLLHSERPKLYTILAFLSATGLTNSVMDSPFYEFGKAVFPYRTLVNTFHSSIVKPFLVASCIKQATCIKQACIQFPKKANTLKCICIKQAPVLSKHFLIIPMAHA